MFSYIVEKKNKLGSITPSSYHAADFLEHTKPWNIEDGKISNCGVRFDFTTKAYSEKHVNDIENPNEPFGNFNFKVETVGNPFSVFGEYSKIEPLNDRFSRFNYAAAELGVNGTTQKDFIISQLQEEAGTANALQYNRDDVKGINSEIDEGIISKEEGLKRVLAGIEEIGETILENQTRYNTGDKEEIKKELKRLENFRKTRKVTGKEKQKIAETIPNYLEAEPVQRTLSSIQTIKNIRENRKIKKNVSSALSAAAKASASAETTAESKTGDESFETAEAKEEHAKLSKNNKEATPYLESVEKKVGKVERKLNTLESAENYFKDNIKTELDAIPINKTAMKKEFKTEYPELYNRFRQYNKLLTGTEEFSNSRLKTVAAFKNAILKSFNAIEDEKFKLRHKRVMTRKKAATVTPSGSPKQKARKTIILTRSQKAAEGAAESK